MHVDNFVFILLVLVAMLFQLLTRFATKSGKRPNQDNRKGSPPPPRVPRVPNETEDERVRKFLEALGQPTTSRPPPPVASRPTYQKPVVFPRVPAPMKSPLPPLTTRPPDLEPNLPVPPEVPLPQQIPVSPEASLFTPKTPAETYAAATTSPASTKLNLTDLLHSTSGLRDAIILREIFGPPRSLQPLDLVGTI